MEMGSDLVEVPEIEQEAKYKEESYWFEDPVRFQGSNYGRRGHSKKVSARDSYVSRTIGWRKDKASQAMGSHAWMTLWTAQEKDKQSQGHTSPTDPVLGCIWAHPHTC
jgi:hypothetical protein